jgi:alpha-tubulin suppressor-like RCC1 family protein
LEVLAVKDIVPTCFLSHGRNFRLNSDPLATSSNEPTWLILVAGFVAMFSLIMYCIGCSSNGLPSDDDSTGDDDNMSDDDDSEDDDSGDDEQEEWLEVSAGEKVTCAIRGENTVVCWGYCAFGQCEPGSDEFKAVSVNHIHGCGIMMNGAVHCWGVDDGSIYDHDQVTSTPLEILLDVSAGPDYNCGVRTDNSVICWGTPPVDFGQTDPPDVPMLSVSIGDNQVCGLTIDHDALCFGGNGAPYTQPPMGSFESVDTGYYHACAIDPTGSVVCWGCDVPEVDEGQCTPPLGLFTQITSGQLHSCGIRDDGAVICWGYNAAGQCDVPAGIFTQVSAGTDHTCAITEQGELYCWGCDNELESGECDVPDQ